MMLCVIAGLVFFMGLVAFGLGWLAGRSYQFEVDERDREEEEDYL